MDGVWSVDLKHGVYAYLLLAYSLITILTYYLLQIYRPDRYRKIGVEVGIILAVNAGSMLALVAVLFALDLLQFSRVLLLVFYACSGILVVAKHIAIRLLQNYFRSKGYNLHHVILIGDGPLAAQFVQSIKENVHMGFCIDGYVGGSGNDALGNHLGDIDRLNEVLENHSVDELVIALDSDRMTQMDLIMQAAYRSGIRTRLIPSYNRYIPTNPSIDSIGSVRLINMNATPLDSVINRMLKRAFDAIASLLGIILFSPLMIVTAVLIKLGSPGPVFFAQERVGKDQKLFKMLKFRSMRVNSDQDSGWSTQADPRRTEFGSIIRKTSIDELPQLFNVLVGQMSLIGPRPEIPFHVEHFKEEIPRYLVRQQVRPGITGWAQINGLRGDTDINKRVEYDLWYINNWCVRLDVMILIRTVFGGFYNDESIANEVHK